MPELIGTVYIVFDGVPALRRILCFEADSIEHFRALARAAVTDQSAMLEFGPIGPRWSGIRA